MWGSTDVQQVAQGRVQLLMGTKAMLAVGKSLLQA